MNSRKTGEMISLQRILADYLLRRATACIDDFKFWISMFCQIQDKLPDGPDRGDARTVTVRRGDDGTYIVEDLALMLPYVGNDPAAYVGHLIDEGEDLVRVYSDIVEDDDSTEVIVLKFVHRESN